MNIVFEAGLIFAFIFCVYIYSYYLVPGSGDTKPSHHHRCHPPCFPPGEQPWIYVFIITIYMRTLDRSRKVIVSIHISFKKSHKWAMKCNMVTWWMNPDPTIQVCQNRYVSTDANSRRYHLDFHRPHIHWYIGPGRHELQIQYCYKSPLWVSLIDTIR